jgi:glucose-6-phosphate 1-dehydrogenase
VIFGATGDLAHRKLFPALLNLAWEHHLTDNTVMLCVSRQPVDENEFRAGVFRAFDEFAKDSPTDQDFRRQFIERIFTFAEDSEQLGPFVQLPDVLKQLSQSFNIRGNVLYYLSVPPSAYESIIGDLKDASLSHPGPGAWVRIIVEKPFGHDLESARKLNQQLCEAFDEEQIFRIDHYLGKETVQNIMVLRLANMFLEPLWNRRYIDHVQITAAESVGVEDRAGYYEEAGALRDMVQNHMLQILSLMAMEPPPNLTPRAVRDEKTKVLESLRPFTDKDLEKNVIRAQYASGSVDGTVVPGYVEERSVNPKSRTETYAALRLYIDNWRWSGVPFYIRTGKRLPKRVTEVAAQFKQVPHFVFSRSRSDVIEPNVLSIRIQPDEGVKLRIITKVPGHVLQLSPVDMEFGYARAFSGRLHDAYEILLLDAILGDPTLFSRRDAVEQGWQFVEPILKSWESDSAPFATYTAGTWGPSEADIMMASGNRRWRKP